MFTDTTKADFNLLLARKLGDEEKVYWTNEELNRIIDEAQLTFGAISGYWKSNILIETKNNQQLYNPLIAADVKTGFADVTISYTYQNILDWLDDNLIGYLQLASPDEIIPLITKAINAYQAETKLVLATKQLNIIIDQPINIGEDVLDIIAAYYIDSSGIYYTLKEADENSIALIKGSYVIDSARPKFYSLRNLSLQQVDLFPRPNENGFLELIYVVGITGVQSESSSCLIPNNLVPYLKYKLLMDIFAKDNNIDPFRAEFCKQRWNEGLIIGNNYSLIVNSKLNGINRVPASILDFNNFRYDWRNDVVSTTKKVNSIALAGYNIIGLNRIPDATAYSLMFECIANAPTTNNYIDIRSDYIPHLLAYCIHLASIKDGIAAIQKTQSNLTTFIKAAAEHSDYLQRRRISYLDLLGKSKYPLKQANVIKEEDAA